MRLTINISDKVVKTLQGEAKKRGLSVDEFIEIISKRELKLK